MELQTISDTYFTVSVVQRYRITQNRIFIHSEFMQNNSIQIIL